MNAPKTIKNWKRPADTLETIAQNGRKCFLAWKYLSRTSEQRREIILLNRNHVKNAFRE